MNKLKSNKIRVNKKIYITITINIKKENRVNKRKIQREYKNRINYWKKKYTLKYIIINYFMKWIINIVFA